MKICHVHIQNYKSLRDFQTDVTDFFTLIGENNAGKTNILTALELFFSGTKTFGEDIFFDRDATKQINIEVTFTGLTDHERDIFAQYLIADRLYTRKSYSFDKDGKCQMMPAALKPRPTEEFLQEGFEDNLNKSGLQALIAQHDLPDYFRQERYSKKRYQEARDRYLGERPELLDPENAAWKDHPRGWPEVFVGYLPDYHVVPAVREATDEEKMTGGALLNRLVNSLVQRIVEQNPQLDELRQQLSEVREYLSLSEAAGVPDRRFDEIKELEEELANTLGEVMPGSGITLDIRPPEPEDLFRLNTRLRIHNGLPTYLEHQGHGLQRAVIFVLLRVYARSMQQQEDTVHQEDQEPIVRRYRKSLIIAFEEPELYLHPQGQRVLRDALKTLAHQDQVVVCTHSPVFIDMGELETLCLVSKPTYENGTTACYCTEDIFAANESLAERKKQFRMATEFTPERSELFFAKKVVLVEGPTERVSIPVVAQRLGIFRRDVCIVECDSKFNIDMYIRVMNAFRIEYVVVHDVDPIPDDLDPQSDKDKYRAAQDLYTYNDVISQCVDSNLGKVEPVDPEFERAFGVSRTRADKVGKPLAAFEHFSDEAKPIPDRLREIAEGIYRYPLGDRSHASQKDG